MDIKTQEEMNKYVRDNGGDPLAPLIKALVDLPKDELEKLVMIAANRLVLAHMGTDGYETPMHAAKGMVMGLTELLNHYHEARVLVDQMNEAKQTEAEFKIPSGFSWGGHGIC